MVEQSMQRKILYIDMDNVLVDFKSAIDKLPATVKQQYETAWMRCRIFSMLEPMPGAVEAFQLLSEQFDTYILSTAPENPTARVRQGGVGEAALGKSASTAA